jgi:hypothetical protein
MHRVTDVLEEVRWNTWTTAVVAGAKAKKPKPIRRPGG